MHVITIIGARPQFIKASVVSKAFSLKGINETIIHTGQHYDYKMSKIFWEELGIKDFAANLNIGSGSHGWQTAKMIEGIESYLINLSTQPDFIVLYGDTNSTLAGALAASKLNIKIVHIEAGLRSYNRKMPEEINRIVTDHLSEILFCSSDIGLLNLNKEGITKNIHIVGDVMYDALLTFSQVASSKINIESILSAVQKDYCLLTLHRAENSFDLNRLENLIHIIGSIHKKVVWPIHPRMKDIISKLTIPSNMIIIEPVSYFEMLILLKNSSKVLTDSGGLQKEAYWLKKPCLTLRSETEWVETLENNWNIIVNDDRVSILNGMEINPEIKTWKPLYGIGNAAQKIADILLENF